MSVPSREPLCMYCTRFIRDSSDPPRCGAFPAGIPEDIFDGRLSHTTPIASEPTFLGSIPPLWELAAEASEHEEYLEGTGGWVAWPRARNVGD